MSVENERMRRMTDDYRIDQRDQTIKGSQTNIGKADKVTIYGSAQYVPPIPHQILSSPADFVGRDEELRDLLDSFDKGATITGLRGMGGIGKTALAFKLAELLRDHYPDGQLMVNLQGTDEKPLTQADAMAQVIRSYLPMARMPEAEAEVANLYRSVLDGKCALLLLDNALDDRQVRPLLPPARCGVIVTSRRKFTLPGLVTKDLDILKPDRAVELLLKVARSSSPFALPHEEKYWNEIANLCGFLPLALRAAGSMLANSPDLGLAKFAEELRDERQRLKRIGKEGVDLDVGASFGLSYNRLVQETARVFGILSIFPADFDAAAEETVCRDEGHRHLSELVRWSLVEYQRPDAEGEGRYHLHDLVRIFAYSRLDLTARDIGQQKHAEYYKNILSNIDELYVKGGEDTIIGRDLFYREWMNIRAGQKWAEDMVDSKSEKRDLALQLACGYPAVGAYALEVLLNPHERIRWLETALLAAQQLENSKMEGSHLGNLGIAYCHIGEVQKAITIFQQRLSISRKIGDAFGESNAIGNIGAAYAMIGETSKAIEFFEQNLFIARMNGDRYGESKSLGNLGLAYYDLGNTGQAFECLEQSLAIDREIGNRQGEGANLGNLGLVHAKMGDTQKAIEYYSQHLVIAHEIGDRRGEGNALSNLGDVYYTLGNMTQAIEYYEKALVVVREIDDRQKEENILRNLGSAYYAIGNARKAVEYYEQELVVIREIGDRQLEENTIGNLGNAYYVLGDAHKPMKYYEQALVIAREIGDREGECNTHINMSLLLNKLGQREKAIDLAKLALEIYEQIESPYAERARKLLAQWQGDEKPI
jgi:tetratricopeptide (TPR) repeat protein